MNSRLSPTNTTIVNAFHATLFHQVLVVLALLAVVLLGWNLIRVAAYHAAMRAASGEAEPHGPSPLSLGPEPTARRVLRVGFGLLWVLDGLLQAQASMPLGMVPGAIAPAASGSPSWVLHLVNFGGTMWNEHPITAAAAAVWIQLGIGIFMLVAPRGPWSRLSGATSVAWGLVVWAFGEAFGGIFAAGPSILFGTPGAVLFYATAGVLVALPESAFVGRKLGRIVLGTLGVFFIGMAAIQAWPGNGFFRPGADDTLSAMSSSMATTPQPGWLASLVRSFGSFDASHAVVVNTIVIVILVAIGVSFVSGERRACRVGFVLSIVFCVADWVLVEDLGFLGGVGTDPNSMIPLLLVVAGGYYALTRPVEAVSPELRGAWFLDDVRARAAVQPSAMFRTLAGLGAVAVVLLGAVPMGLASMNKRAETIVAQAVDGPVGAIDSPAPAFSLTDQYGKTVTLRSLDRKVVVLVFLDPVCTSDCPLIAQEMRQADQSLSAAERRRVDFVAIVANPIYHSVADVRAFDSAEGLAGVRNWLYLTGSRSALEQAWNRYGLEVDVEPDGAMIAHTDIGYVIGRHERLRYELDTDPGPGSEATEASFETVVVNAVSKTLSKP